MLTYAGEALAALRKIKSEAKVSMKTPILSVTLDAVDDAADSIKSTLGDIAEAGRVVGNITLVRAGAAIKAVKQAAAAAKNAAEAAKNEADAAVAVIVKDSELGEPPAKKPRK